MKKVLFILLAAMPLLFASCEKNNVEDSKDGTIVENPKDDVGGEMILHIGDAISGLGWVEIQDGNMHINPDVYDHNCLTIASVGAVNSLADVDYIPTSGWAQDMEIIIGHGYIIKYIECNDYTRLRFLEYIDKGAAKGYRIRIQTGWDPLMD